MMDMTIQSLKFLSNSKEKSLKLHHQLIYLQQQQRLGKKIFNFLNR